MTGNGGMENGSAWPRTSFGSLDVLADVPHELSAQIGDGGEDATGDDVALDPGEPQFDVVEPGRESAAGHDIAGAMSNAYRPDTMATFHEQLRAA